MNKLKYALLEVKNTFTNIPMVCGYIVYLLVLYLGVWTLDIILLILVSLAITID